MQDSIVPLAGQVHPRHDDYPRVPLRLERHRRRGRLKTAPRQARCQRVDGLPGLSGQERDGDRGVRRQGSAGLLRRRLHRVSSLLRHRHRMRGRQRLRYKIIRFEE